MSRSIGGDNTYGRQEPVKVVIINTQYVETDATSFKSVVQGLTGKDSVIPGIAKSSSSSLISKKRFQRQTTTAAAAAVHDGGNSNCNKKPVVLAKGMSFKDLDRLLMELPSMDELYRLCAD